MIKLTHYEIASYWAGEWKTLHDAYGKGFIIDLGEPACFACGNFWYGRYDRAGWNKSPLQRCHLVPEQFGGQAVASNLILLCLNCHESAPDVNVASYMLRWALNRPSFVQIRLREFKDACSTLGITLAEILPIIEEHGLELSKFVGAHWGSGVKASSWVAAALEFKAKEMRAA